jgi:hypothetical protein
MNTAKIYKDIDGNECSIMQMVRREPDWAANRVQEGEKAFYRLDAGRDYLMSTPAGEITAEGALEALGFGRNGLWS